MSYKIYTYADPYNLDKADFWEEISSIPHFCGARTLVNGLIDVLGDKIQGLICDLDALIDHKDVFQNWTKNIGIQLQQYSILSSKFKQLLDNGTITEEFYRALSQNQHYFLEAIRLFIELDISASSIDIKQANREQKLFIEMLEKLQKSSLFAFPKIPTKESLTSTIVDIAKTEIDDCKKYSKSQENTIRCIKAFETTKNQSLNAVVIHAVHQFSPTQLRLITAMEKMGITIIFLYNYQEKYSKIYSSWNDIYSCFDTVAHHDSVHPEYQIPTMTKPGNALAFAIGEICENGYALGSTQLKRWHNLYKSIELREFANITEYAHYVSNYVETARNKYYDSLNVSERGNDVWNNSAILKRLEEQVYTANRDIHTLLNIYYPEFSPERHFLSYPIGQFFSAIYRLWDYEKACIKMDTNAIKECLSSGILKTASSDKLLRTFYNVSVIFEELKTYEDFQKRIVNSYLSNYKKITTSKSTDFINPLKQLEIYNKYKVTQKDIEHLIQSIEEINEIAKLLFVQDSTQDDFISFGEHFSKLEAFLKQRELALANHKERELIYELQQRLEQIKPESTKYYGTFHDLQNSIHYYLKQKSENESSVDWIVKNFEQIDGDILQSKRQFEKEVKKTYHFACLSDRDMNRTVNDQLPWPLTDEFLSVAYFPQELQFQVYCKTLERRSDFLRYELFYGLCYNRTEVSLSFVRQYGDETNEPYSLLTILGFQPKSGPIEKTDHKIPFGINVPRETVSAIKYDSSKMMDMFLCPYRYFLDYVAADSPVINGDFLIQKYYENLLIKATWKRIAGQDKTQMAKSLSKIVQKESKNLKPFFITFWKEVDFPDLERRANNYLLNSVINKGYGRTVNAYSDDHMQIRQQFGAAKFRVNISEIEQKNPFPVFEGLTETNYPLKDYPLHKLNKLQNNTTPQNTRVIEALKEETKLYINQTYSNDKTAIPSDWCNYCPHKGTCMEPFIATELVTRGLTSSNVSRRRNRVQFKEATARTDRPILDSALNNEAQTDNHAQSKESSETSRDINPIIQREINSFKSTFQSLQKMISDNSLEINELKRQLSSKQEQNEDTKRIETDLAEQQKKSQELKSKLKEAEDRLAESEAENLNLANTIKQQENLIGQKKALGFTEEEYTELTKYSAIIIFDTCSIMNYPNLLSGVHDGELVVVPKDVNNELENHKTNHFDERKIKAQKAISAIFNYKRRYPLIYSDAVLDLVPDVYRADAGKKELNDNRILSVAIRYKRYTEIPVVFITDDKSLSNKADGEDIEVWTAQDFLSPSESAPEIETDKNESTSKSVSNSTPTESTVNTETINSEMAVSSEQSKEKAREKFLQQKISVKNLQLDARQISILQNNGIKTLADFMIQSKESFSRVKSKKGMPFVAKYLKEQERIAKKLEQL